MAGTDRASSYGLILRLLEKPHGFDFFQAVRRIECARARGPRVGATIRLKDDPVRFSQEPTLGFASSTISRYESRGGDGSADRITVNFMGLFGPNGALPLHLTEYARERERNHRDPTFHRFCDVFHHRMISMFYRAWAVNQPTTSFDRVTRDPEADRFGVYLASLFGMGMPSLRRRDAVADIAKQHFAGRLAQQTRSPEGLEALVGDFFGVACRIEEFLGQWIDLPEGSTLRLGESPTTGVVGQTAIVGSRIWDRQQRFRLRIGPVTMAEYSRFLPGGRSFARLVSWVRTYVGYEYLWDAQLVLRKEDVPGTRLGGEPGDAGPGPRLGWTTWIRSDPDTPPEEDRGDLVLRAPSEIVAL